MRNFGLPPGGMILFIQMIKDALHQPDTIFERQCAETFLQKGWNAPLPIAGMRSKYSLDFGRQLKRRKVDLHVIFSSRFFQTVGQ